MQERQNLIPGSGRSPGRGNGEHFSILAWEIPRSLLEQTVELRNSALSHTHTHTHTHAHTQEAAWRSHGPLPGLNEEQLHLPGKTEESSFLQALAAPWWPMVDSWVFLRSSFIKLCFIAALFVSKAVFDKALATPMSLAEMARGKDAALREECSCPASPHWERPLLFSGNRQISLCARCFSQHSLWFPSPKWISQASPQVKKERKVSFFSFLGWDVWDLTRKHTDRGKKFKGQSTFRSSSTKASYPVNKQRPCEAGAFLLSIQWFIDSALWYLWEKKIKVFPEKHVTSKHYYFRGQSLSTWANILDTWKEEEKMGHVAPGVEAI